MNIWTRHLHPGASDDTVADTAQDMADAIERDGDVVLNRTIERVTDYRSGQVLAAAVHVMWEAKR